MVAGASVVVGEPGTVEVLATVVLGAVVVAPSVVVGPAVVVEATVVLVTGRVNGPVVAVVDVPNVVVGDCADAGVTTKATPSNNNPATSIARPVVVRVWFDRFLIMEAPFRPWSAQSVMG